MDIHGMPALLPASPPSTPRTAEPGTQHESIRIAVRVVEPSSLAADVAIKSVVDRVRHRAFDSHRVAVVEESAIHFVPARDAFSRNYRAADLARTHVRSMLTYGSNAAPDAKLNAHDARRRLGEFFACQIRYLEKLVEFKRVRYRWGMNSSGQQVLCFRRVDLMALSAHSLQKWGYGHCAHQAAAAWYFLRECKLHDGLVELCHFQGGDHVLVLIGRSPASDPDDMRTWGPDVVVCDPWANKTYPLSALDEMRLPENDVQNFLLAPGAHYLSGIPRCMDMDEWRGVPECRISEVDEEPERIPAHDPLRRSLSAPW